MARVKSHVIRIQKTDMIHVQNTSGAATNCWPSITGGPHPSNICRHDGEFHYDKNSTGRKAHRPWHSGECGFACYTLYLIHWSQHLGCQCGTIIFFPGRRMVSSPLLRTETLLPRTLSWKQELMSTSRTRSEVASIILSSLLPPSLPPSLSVCLYLLSLVLSYPALSLQPLTLHIHACVSHPRMYITLRMHACV